jgi:hypothetical protein
VLVLKKGHGANPVKADKSFGFAQDRHWNFYMINFGDTGLRCFVWQLPLLSF